MIDLLLLYAIAALNIIIALVVLMKSRRLNTSFMFVLSAVCVFFWAGGDALMLGATDPTYIRLGSVLFLVAPLYVMYFLLLFAKRFPVDTKPGWRTYVYWLVPIALASYLLAAYPDAVLTASVDNSVAVNVIAVEPRIFLLYALMFSGYFLAICWVFVRKIVAFKGLKRTQTAYVFAGAFTSSVLAFSTNLSLPLLGISTYVWLGPLFTLSYIISYSFAIAKYSLFDIRRFAIRTIAYIFSLGSVIVAYAFAITVLRRTIQARLGAEIDPEVFFTGITIVAVLIFPHVKKGFDIASKRIFFRNDYETQDIIDTFSDILLKNMRPEMMVKELERVFRDTFSTTTTIFVFQDPALGHGMHHDADEKLRQQLRAQATHSIMTIDDIEQDTPLRTLLDDTQIGMIVRLNTAKTKLGWMLLSEKMNGEPYDRQDIRTVDVVADEIAIALENALRYKQIQAFNVTLSAKVEEATTELRRSNEKLRQLDQVKDEFVSMASHQLRTPLTSIKGYLSMVLEGDAGELNPMQRKFLEEAYNSSQRMVFLIGDFLNVSRLNTGKFIIEKNRTNLADMVAEEVDQLQPSAAARQMRIEYHKPARFPLQNLDENKLRQVVMNFMDNAIYYSTPGGVIKVELTHTAQEITLKVKDRGIGVPVAQQHRLFEKFYRATNAQKARPDGSGIGLFLAKKVVVAHQGSIIFESAENKGSTFGFKIPLTPFSGNAPVTAKAADTQKIPA